MNWTDLSSRLLIGTYTRDRSSDGIYLLDQLGQTHCVATCDNPSYLALDPKRPVVYCVNEISDFQQESEDSKSGAISAYDMSNLNHPEPTLTFINQLDSMGADPCHLSIAPNAKFLVVSNYSGGSFASFELEQDGALESFQSLTTHQGGGPIKSRQASAHVHSSLLSGSDLFVADLGSDHISRYTISDTGLVAGEQQHAASAPGAGPRFLTANQESLFVLNELNNTLAKYDLRTLKNTETIPIVPDANTESIAAHLAFSPDGEFLYLTNRGFDTLVVVRVKPTLEVIQTIATGGQHPRHFSLVHGGEYIVVANQDSDNLVVFARDSASGLVSHTGIEISVPCPTCVIEVKAPAPS